ncbi:MAG: hypothetical protein ACW9W3_07555 [Candidatus Nitrosopumilus sp. bin_68KS]
MEDNDNPKGIPEVERVKWFIARIDLYHKINLQSIESSKRIFETAGEQTLAKIKSQRKRRFSILGVILTGILSIHSFYSIPEWMFYLSLAILAGISILNYIFFNRIESLIEEAFNFISQITNEARINIAESQSFVSSNFADLGYIELKIVKNYGVFAILLGIANVVNMVTQLKKFRNENTAWFVDLFKEDFKETKKMTEQVPSLFERFDRTNNYPIEGFDLIEKTLTKYSKIKNQSKKD